MGATTWIGNLFIIRVVRAVEDSSTGCRRRRRQAGAALDSTTSSGHPTELDPDIRVSVGDSPDAQEAQRIVRIGACQKLLKTVVAIVVEIDS
ncbi:MAG: hypothetical protein FJ405_00125 [Verrucomicrobia bacterium]|nr:hypothetical protein [Verrucomicrobiota bacterium]